MFYKKNPIGIPRLADAEEQTLRDAEIIIDAELNMSDDMVTWSLSGMREHVPNMSLLAWRALLLMYENAGYEVIEAARMLDPEETFWRIGYTPRVQKR